jgi:hypothetical protein
VPSNVTDEQLNAVVTAAGGELLGLAGLESGIPKEDVWLVEVPGAKSESDTERVLNILISYPEIRSAELNSILTIQN